MSSPQDRTSRDPTNRSSKASSAFTDFKDARDLGDVEKGELQPENHTPTYSTAEKISEPQDPQQPQSQPQPQPQEQPPAAAAPPPPGPPPDGGRDAWLSVVGGWCGFFVSFGWLNSIGVFQEYYQQGPLAHYSPSAVSWIASTEIFFLFAGGPICGKIFDSYGPRGLLIAGSFLHVFGLMMLSLGSQYYQFFLAQSVCSAMGACAIFYASMNAVSTWFLKKRATAIGIMISGSSVGGVVLPILVVKVIPHAGFGWAVRAIGFIVLGLCLVEIATLKSRLNHVPKRFSVLEFVRPLSELPFALLVCASFFTFLGIWLPFNYLILEGQKVGMGYGLSNYLIPILNAVSVIGRVLPGYLADRLGRYNMVILVTALSTIFVLGLWLPGNSPAPTIVFAALYGFSSGAFVSLGPAVVAQICEIREIGVRNGTVYAFVSIAVLVGNPIGGALVTANDGDFTYLQVFCGVAIAIGCAFFVASRTAKVGLKKKVF